MSLNPIVNKPDVEPDGTRPYRPAPRGNAEVSQPHRRVSGGLLDPKMLWKSTPEAFRKLDPRVQIHNPVMFVVEIGSVLTTYSAIIHSSAFAWTITAWLWLTVAVRQPGRGGRRGPGQGAGRDAPADQAGDRRAPAGRLDSRARPSPGKKRSRAPSSPSATSWSWSRAN